MSVTERKITNVNNKKRVLLMKITRKSNKITQIIYII